MLTIDDKEFEKIRDIMYKRTGVYLKPTKKPLVISRLRKRLEELKLERFIEYIVLLEKPNSEELEFFINAITTNETFFFRHGNQFAFLSAKVLPEFFEQSRVTAQREFRVWSAACSTGEEPYSIAITCKEFFEGRAGCRFKVFASDINSRVVNKAKIGRYIQMSFKETPEELKSRYFKCVEKENRHGTTIEYEIDSGIKAKVEYGQHNLLMPAPHRGLDVVFLRNVMIYFTQEIKQKVVSNVEAALKPGGYFFISLSETLNDVKSSLKFVESGIYQKMDKV